MHTEATRTRTRRIVAGRPPHPHLDGQRRCACGQELDVWRRQHCPRCGHRLSGPGQARAS